MGGPRLPGPRTLAPHASPPTHHPAGEGGGMGGTDRARAILYRCRSSPGRTRQTVKHISHQQVHYCFHGNSYSSSSYLLTPGRTQVPIGHRLVGGAARGTPPCTVLPPVRGGGLNEADGCVCDWSRALYSSPARSHQQNPCKPPWSPSPGPGRPSRLSVAPLPGL